MALKRVCPLAAVHPWLLFAPLALAFGCGSSRSDFNGPPGGGGNAGAGAVAGGSGTAGSGAGATGGAGGSAGMVTTGGTGGSAGASGGAGGGAGTAASSGAPGGGTGGAPMAGAGGNASGSGGASGTPGGGNGGSAGAPAGDNPPPGEYAEREMLPFANSEMAVAETNGVIYVLGGYPSSREVQTTVQAYTIASDTWDIVASLPLPLHHPVALGFEGKVYSLGGQSTMSSDGDTGRSFVYDPGQDEWTELATMPTARGAGAGAIVGDVIYVGGGRPPAGNAFEAYDVSEDEWTELPPLPTQANERNHLAAAAVGTKVYFAGGRYDGGGFSDPMTDRLDVFDTVAKTWSPGASMLRERGGVNGVLAFGCFHVWGGEGANTGEVNDVFPDHDVYDPRSDSWTPLAPLPTPVHGVTGAAFVDGLIYMPGGGIQQGESHLPGVSPRDDLRVREHSKITLVLESV
jgi:hypothetical protein